MKAIFKTILLHPSNWGRIRRTNRYPSMLAPAYRRISHNGSRNSRSAPTLHSPAISRRVVLACVPYGERPVIRRGSLFNLRKQAHEIFEPNHSGDSINSWISNVIRPSQGAPPEVRAKAHANERCAIAETAGPPGTYGTLGSCMRSVPGTPIRPSV